VKNTKAENKRLNKPDGFFTTKTKIQGNVTAPNSNREFIESIGAMLRGGFVEHPT
jgi:hypothetical protein